MLIKKSVFGTKEWASHNVNCCIGCAHNCLYCYAKFNAVKKFKTVKPGEWNKELIDSKAVARSYPTYYGTVMFPSQHDITPFNVDACLVVLHKLLKAKNNVLIVMKPHLDCINKICSSLLDYKEQIIFRFTICASDDAILQYWEPRAPTFKERFEALQHAYKEGFQTSISMEPCLDWPNVVANFNLMAPYVTNSIWIGTLNFIDQRVEVENDKDREMVAQMKSWMTQETFQKVYDALKDHPLIKWKESMKKALGLPEVDKVGKDI